MYLNINVNVNYGYILKNTCEICDEFVQKVLPLDKKLFIFVWI